LLLVGLFDLAALLLCWVVCGLNSSQAVIY